MAAPARIRDLAPSRDLLAVFEDCHNAIYAHDGLLKDRIFSEITKLLVLKLADERRDPDAKPLFAPGLGQDHPDFESLRALAAERQPDFIGTDERFPFSAESLDYVMSRLAPISLTDSPGDIKGQAFQTFVYRHQRGDRGEFFTPHPVVRLAVMMLAPGDGERVIDPACGSGGFLLEMVDFLKRVSGPEVERYVRECVRGWEFNPEVARAAAVRLELEGALGHEIEVRNSLLDPSLLAGEFDLVATNPPFGSKGKVESPDVLRQYELGHRWKRLDDAWIPTESVAPQTPEILFIELCVRLLRPGGRLAIVLPDGILQNSKVGYVRQWLQTQTEVSAVISLPSETFVPYGTGIKTSLLLARRLTAGSRSRACFMSQIADIGYDAKGRRTDAGSPGDSSAGATDDLPRVLERWQRFEGGSEDAESEVGFAVPRHLLNSRLDVEHYLPDDVRLIATLKEAGARPLSEHATILNKRTNLAARRDERIRYVAISNLDAATMRIASQDEMLASEAPSRATYELESGDILTAVAGASTGTRRHVTAWVGEREVGAICSNGLAVLRDIRDLEPYYLLAFLRSEVFLRQVKRLRTGHAIPAVSLADLGTILVPPAPSEAQRAVADHVAEMFGLIEQATDIGERVTSILKLR